ncbi:MAG: hypothetical protein WCG14_00205 [Chlamydiia bacterium]
MTEHINFKPPSQNQPKESSVNPTANFSEIKKNVAVSSEDLTQIQSSGLSDTPDTTEEEGSSDPISGPWAQVLPPGATKKDLAIFLRTLETSVVYQIKHEAEKVHAAQKKMKDVIEGKEPED